LHDPIERDRQEGRRDDIGQQRGVADQPAMADAHATDREARQRADEQSEKDRGDADIKAVAELVPEILKIPIALSDDDPEALHRGLLGPNVIGEDVAMRFERHYDDVVDRRQRPDQDDEAKHDRSCLGKRAAQPISADLPKRRRGCKPGAHSLTSVVRSLRISRITSGIISGRSDITAATPRSGLPTSKASRMPRVASTWVDKAGPPPETKYTELKSPKVKIVESSVQTR